MRRKLENKHQTVTSLPSLLPFLFFFHGRPFPFYIFLSLGERTLFRNFDHLFPPEYEATLFLSRFSEEERKERRRGMKIPQPLNTIFHDDTGGSAQSTIRYSYVRGMRTACPNSAASFCGKIRAFRDRLNNNRPGLKRSNSSPGDIAVQKIYTEYVFLHRDFSFSFFFFLLRLFNEGTVNYRAANRDGLAKSKTGWCEDLSISRITGEIILCSF